jgi:hypothetical protein
MLSMVKLGYGLFPSDSTKFTILPDLTRCRDYQELLQRQKLIARGQFLRWQKLKQRSYISNPRQGISRILVMELEAMNLIEELFG